MPRIFWDTYALVEFIRGNAAFQKYDQRYGVVTSRLNLMELYYTLLRDGDAVQASGVYDSYRPHAVDADDALVKDAMGLRLRLRRQRRRLSYADAVGYALAVRHGIRFLTGDPALRGLPAVEFVR